MKNTIYTIAAFILLASCSKTPSTSCYTCTSKMTILTPAHDSTSVVNYCDKTEEDIQAIQNAGSTSTTNMYSYTTCKKN